jgi:tetratricopeptide (TPR) repeat protein
MSRLQQLQDFLEAQPNDPFLLFAIAKEYEGMGDRQQALAFYTHLRETTPQYVGLYYHLGKLYVKLDRREEALETYKKGMEIAKAEKDNHAYNELAGAKMEISYDDDDEEDY